MNALEQIIIDKIKKQGAIPFETFMDMALYYPGLGYYSSPETTIGKDGDFYTSPHLHPIFGAMIGKQLMEMWSYMGRPSSFHAVEMGAGVGYLSKDIFDYFHQPSKDSVLTQDKADFLASLRYAIVEPYPHFAERQRELLSDYLKKERYPPPPFPSSLRNGGQRGAERNYTISWVSSFNELGQGIRGCMFSNELLDAFPVHLVEMEHELKEIYVNFNGEELVEEKNKVSDKNIFHYIERYAPYLQRGYRTEINLNIKRWLEDMRSTLLSGFLLTVDYGYSAKEYYDEDRSKGTLLCYHKHLLNENPYGNIGRQDITAHVNFSSLKQWGEDLGLRTIGYCPQGTYLMASGIDEVITDLYADTPDYPSEISKIKGLIMPQGMGESHNIMIQYRGEGQPELRGFSMRNLAESL